MVCGPLHASDLSHDTNCSVFLTLESAAEFLWGKLSNKTSAAVLSHCTTGV